MRQRGLALVLVVGVLGVLAVLGSAFAVLSRLERRVAAQRVQGTKAALLARSGIEDAAARLALGQDPLYGGEDWDNSGTLNGFEGAAEVFQRGTLNTRDCPAGQALRPSFFVRSTADVGADVKPAPERVRVDGRHRGFTGRFPASDRAAWTLKVLPAGGFHVNGGDPSVLSNPAAVSDCNTNLRRMLGVLAEAIDREVSPAQTGADDGVPVDQADGWNLIDCRPRTQRGWESLGQIRDLALGGSQAKLDALRDYLLLSSWVDHKVVGSNLDPGRYVGAMPWWTCWGELKHYRRAVGSSRAPDFERLPPVTGRNVGRAPVSLDWARTRRAALIALLADLRGVYFNEWTASVGQYGQEAIASIRLDWSQPTDDCRGAADLLLASTSELRTWEQWNAFCDGLPMTGTSDLPQAKRDLLKANFNPNSDLNAFNPDVSMARLVDKGSLLQGSTELDLSSCGARRVVCLARILDAGGSTVASRTLSQRTGAGRVFRITTQREFVAGDLGDPDLPGDEGSYRAYGSSPYICRSDGIGKTFGHLLFGDPGVGLQTWPEPHTAWTSPGTKTPADYDGRVGSATMETSDGQWVSTATSMLFLARWTDTFNADRGGNRLLRPFLPPPSGPPPGDNLPAVTAALWDATKPGQFFPDGVYSERFRMPGYAFVGNMTGFQGVVTFWVKPNYDIRKCRNTTAPRHHMLFNATHRSGGNFRNTAVFSISHHTYCYPNPVGLLAGNGQLSFVWDNDLITNTDNLDEAMEYLPTAKVFQKHRWFLASAYYDTRCTSPVNGNHLCVDRGLTGTDDRGISSGYRATQLGVGYNFALAGSGTANFYLGYGGNAWSISTIDNNHPSPDMTVDEFALYDLGRYAAGVPAFDLLIRNRFEEGRYYKESLYPDLDGLVQPRGFLSGRTAGEYFSAPVRLPVPSARIRLLSWTQVVPRGLRSPRPTGAGVRPEDGDDGADGRIALELAHAGVQVPALPSAAYALDSAGRAIGGLFTRSGGERLGRVVSAPFRLHAVFQPNLSQQGTTALLEPLVLDDVSVHYQDATQSPYTAWGEEE